MLQRRVWRIAISVLLMCLLAASASAFSSSLGISPSQQRHFVAPSHPVGTLISIEAIALINPREVAWVALLAVAILAWVALLRHQVRAKTRALEQMLEAHRKEQQFDATRNEVLESIAHNAPLPESMERLASAVEQQISGSLCVIVMPAEARSFGGTELSPLLIAPSLREDLQPPFAAAVGSAFICEYQDHPESAGTPLSATLLQILRNAGLAFQAVHTTALFSTTASLGGLLLLFVSEISAAEMQRAKTGILPSAARLASLARSQCFMHERLLHEARHDSLTGLPNRAVAEDRLEQAMARAQRNSKSFAVFCLDLDGFKEINDQLGHEAGDCVLRAVASRLRGRIRHSDTLARMGGDEFWAILEDCSGMASAEMAARALIAALEEPVSFDGRTLSVSASLGIALYPTDGRNASQLKRHADQAMYKAKGLGGRQISFWSAEELAGRRLSPPPALPSPLRNSAKAT